MSNWPVPEVRFWQKVVKQDDGCWLWTGAKKKAGYGHFMVGPGKVIAHRWSYQFFVGPIPEGYEIDHLCRVKACVNPAHLEAVTIAENRRRRNDAKTHCSNGHEYTPENTYWWTDSDGYRCRFCQTCRGVGGSRTCAKCEHVTRHTSGLCYRHRGYAPPRHPLRDTALDRYYGREPVSAIAVALGLSPTTVQKWINADPRGRLPAPPPWNKRRAS